MTERQQYPCILKSGHLQLKRSPLAPSKKYVVLCAPLTVEDMHLVLSSVFKINPTKGMDAKGMFCLGHIACAAVKGTPLLIVLDSKTATASPTFVQFSDIQSISDETQLRSACNFAIHCNVKPYDYRFSCSSSTDYQEWNLAFGRAMQILTDRTMGGMADGEGSPLNGSFHFEQAQAPARYSYEEDINRHSSPVPPNNFGTSPSNEWASSPPSVASSSTQQRKAKVLPDYIAPPPTMSRTYTLTPSAQSPDGSSSDSPRA
ncbi:uncharacterized protein EV422DRAFT_623102 [Fimicolochytrium jonesii]|uniref:uncharacterized protein n=1 Tax=Fimicolochytrium jonesii TaxID=1396493 RepID=UPI0022FE0D2E|nr:uncharacterized protein EV422DRAFT_623102 [Fimicolochytrium jonesii]KAI8816823.1 hypothetical protein EV422DRAFT_623102 [Fimicolochytrium jonesii]